MKILRLNILDSYKVIDFLEEFNIFALEEILMYLRDPNTYVLTDGPFECLAIFTPINRNLYHAHLYKKKSVGGKRLKDFIYLTGYKVMNETECTSILNFAPADNKPLIMMMGIIGSTRLGLIPGAVGGKDAIAYTANKQDFYEMVEDKYREVIRCQ